MSEADLRREDTLRWLRYSMEDLQSAEGLARLRSGAPRNTCYLAQQAAEKALKAVLVFEGMEVPRSHDLDLLRSRIPAAWPVKDTAMDVTALSEWATTPRYPGDLPEATEAEADTAVAQARGVLEEVLRDFAARGVTL